MSEIEQIRLFDESKTNKQMVEMNSLMSKIETQATSLMTKVNGISFDNIDSSKLEKIKNEIEEIQSVAREDIDLDLNTGELLGDLNKLQSEIKNLEKVEGLYQEFNKISDAIREAGGDTENFTNELRQLENIASSLDGSFDRAFKGANNELREMRDNLRHVNSEARNVSDSSGFMNDFMGNFTQFKLADIAFDALIDGLRMAVQGIKETVVETDGALTDLRKVYEDFGSLDIGGYLDQVTEVAKASGKASVDVIQGTAKGIQMGIKDINEALEFAKQSAIFSNVGDVSQDVADSTLSAIMSSFGGVENSLKPVREQIKGAGEDYNTLTKFMDLANYAGNKFAVSTADVGEALKRSSSALQANGVSMEQSVAMATAMNEVLQDAGKAGTSLKSLSASLTGVQVSARDGSIELTKAGKALKEYANIEVWNKQTGEIKNMYDVMDELAVKWNDLSEVQRTALGTAIAGKTQLNSFNALLQNWDTAKRYVKEYKEGLTVGSAERENAEYIDSIAGKWNEVKENMKSVANELVSGNMAKGFLDGLVSITEGLDKAVALANDSMTHLFEGTADKAISDNIFASLEKGFGGFSDEVNKIVGTFSDAVGGISEFVAELLMIPPGMKPIVNILKEMKNEAKMDEQIAQRESHIKALTTEINTLQNQKQAISEIAKEYDTLNEKTNRTAEENRKLLELKEKLVQIDGDLVLGYDQNGNAILKNLQLQTAEYERQIKLKEQARRVEENSLANDIMQRRIEQQKEYNQALLEYHEMTVATETKRKQSAFGDETLQEYAQRIIENNKKITESNAEAYEKRLADHVQYINDEKALQERYINQMENNDAFIKMAENQKQSILQVMDTIDWSKFSFGEGSQFTQELSKMGDKIVETTEKMGAQAQAINDLENAYASNKAGLIEYTKGLGEQYEIAKKLDAESFTNWKANLQSFVDTTGDLQTANKAIEEMAQSLHEVTGIDVSTWKEALTFDPAPIDAGSQALQRFLQTYGESVNNLNTSDLAQKLASQFEAVQSTYQQMVQDLASGQEIDVEYLINANINQPEPISKLIEKIVADEKVEPQEIDVLLQAQAEIINSGTLSDETVKEIAEAFNMSEKEVRAQFNVKAEVKKTDTSELEETVQGWDKIEAKEKILKLVEIVIGEDKFNIAMKIWNLIFPSEEKEQTLKKLTIREIQECICKKYGVSIGQILSSDRTASLVTPRQLAMYISRKYTTKSLQEIAAEFDKKHATILHGVKAIEKRLDVESELKGILSEVLGEFGYNIADKME